MVLKSLAIEQTHWTASWTYQPNLIPRLRPSSTSFVCDEKGKLAAWGRWLTATRTQVSWQNSTGCSTQCALGPLNLVAASCLKCLAASPFSAYDIRLGMHGPEDNSTLGSPLLDCRRVFYSICTCTCMSHINQLTLLGCGSNRYRWDSRLGRGRGSSGDTGRGWGWAWPVSRGIVRRLFIAAGELGGDLGALRRVVGQLEYQADTRGLYEHHGIRVKQVLRGISVDLEDVVIEPQPSLGSLATRSDLRELRNMCT